jgi:metal-dependent amidase/aminoacylase/carboxypeptidase family protein
VEVCDRQPVRYGVAKRDGRYASSELNNNGDTPMVHHPNCVFDDAILATGAAYWVTLTEQYLSE